MIIPKPNLQMLFTASRVVTTLYRIVSTTMLLAYLVRRGVQRLPEHNAAERYRRD